MDNKIPVIWILLGIGAMSLIFLRWYGTTISNKQQVMTVSEIPDFSLLTQDSVQFTKANLLGKITIADFIFTSCGGPCPLMSTRMQDFQKKVSYLPSVKLLSISVDPEYDTPSILTEYGTHFSVNKNYWTFLTGTKKDIYSLAIKGFHIAIEADSVSILHSTKFVLLDKKAVIRGYYDYDDSTSTKKLFDDINSLIAE